MGDDSKILQDDKNLWPEDLKQREGTISLFFLLLCISSYNFCDLQNSGRKMGALRVRRNVSTGSLRRHRCHHPATTRGAVGAGVVNAEGVEVGAEAGVTAPMTDIVVAGTHMITDPDPCGAVRKGVLYVGSGRDQETGLAIEVVLVIDVIGVPQGDDQGEIGVPKGGVRLFDDQQPRKLLHLPILLHHPTSPSPFTLMATTIQRTFLHTDRECLPSNLEDMISQGKVLSRMFHRTRLHLQ